MALETEFMRDNRVIVTRVVGKFDLAEYIQLAQKLNREVLDNATAPIHGILDFSQTQGFPNNVLSGAVKIAKARHRNSGLLIYVASNPVGVRFLEMFIKLTKNPDYRLCKTFEDALAQIDAVIEDEA